MLARSVLAGLRRLNSREERLLSLPSVLALGALVAANLGTLFWLPFALSLFYDLN